MNEIRDLKRDDRIILWQYRGLNVQGGHAGVVIREVDRLGKQSVIVQLDGIDDPFELTDEDYFDKKAEHFEDCKNNSVHQPNHYQFGQFTAAKIIELVGRTYKSAPVFYHVGNALKYLMRAPRKNGLEDIKKAKQSIEFAIETWEAEENGI
ncbi:DUF3310 domain-containing protein [Staphylococcus simulans]|uniref:DUF3310 domain-containing protein n=1 Tax=Staphylococcus simulans TaxID=1286 RepID=UPI000D1F69A1|nr:DUF3310 domain-containing protein [Staphylococcus simulans]PTJ09081.1 hypothetical protein BU044_11135 [Staphylococcus simulans]PTJ38176.1 hypothetical protein BU021_11730 [Staphylococcus simulans]